MDNFQKKIYEEFISKHKVLEGNQGAKRVFGFISSADNVSAMIAVSNVSLPALTIMAKRLEERFTNDSEFPLTERKNRLVVGKMISYILRQYGYTSNEKCKQKRLIKKSKATLFTMGGVYEKDTSIQPRRKLVFKIKERK